MIVANLFRTVALLPLLAMPALGQDATEHVHDDHAHETSVGDISVVHPWARAASAGGSTLVFMEFENAGEPDKLVGASAEVSGTADIVGIQLGGDQGSTVSLGSMDIPAGDIALDFGGIAIELTDLTEDLVKADHFHMTLVFERAGEIEIEVEVEDANATEHSHAGHSH